MRLIEIAESGEVSEEFQQHELLREVVVATKSLYQKTGFQRPWVSYMATADGNVQGTCAFKSPPANGAVEIAYFTFPEHEGHGVATAMAQGLINLARKEDDRITVIAQTLPESNASTSILKKLGFTLIGEVDHPEDGLVWEWHLKRTDD